MSRHNIIHMKTKPLRLYIFDRHLHHGLDGVILFVVAMFLMWTDRHDFPWAFAKDPEPGV
jgi:hypothetical protein